MNLGKIKVGKVYKLRNNKNYHCIVLERLDRILSIDPREDKNDNMRGYEKTNIEEFSCAHILVKDLKEALAMTHPSLHKDLRKAYGEKEMETNDLKGEVMSAVREEIDEYFQAILKLKTPRPLAQRTKPTYSKTLTTLTTHSPPPTLKTISALTASRKS